MLKLAVLFVVAWGLYWGYVRLMRSMQLFQPIYKLSPESHQKKTTTPSMGGIVFNGLLVVLVIYFQLFSAEALWLLCVTLAFSGLGIIDDCASLLKHKNGGLLAKHKLYTQCVMAVICVWLFSRFIDPLSLYTQCFYVFVLVGSVNATNLTDGLDGLLAGLSMITLLGFIYVFPSSYSDINSIILGLILFLGAFLLWNKYPAKVFMGDAGSLSLGAMFAGLAMILGNPWILLGLGGVYVCETLSVIIQVSVYKITKRRVFLMSPLHHHFELLGLSEASTVVCFWVVGIIFCVITLLRYGG